MKSIIRSSVLIILAFLVFNFPGFAQYAYRINPLPSLPASCNPANGDVVFLTAGAGVSPGLYTCTAANTWRSAGFVANGMVWAQGTLTANSPVINHSATWNNAAVTFSNIVSNVTNTASNAASTLIDLQVGGTSQFSVTRSGGVTATGAITSGATSALGFFGRTILKSDANGRLSITDNAGTGFGRITLGPETVEFPSINAVTVGGQAQGIQIYRGNNTQQIFANLGAATNGTMTYCGDCTKATPCAGGGTGALAVRLNGAWDCNP